MQHCVYFVGRLSVLKSSDSTCAMCASELSLGNEFSAMTLYLWQLSRLCSSGVSYKESRLNAE